MIHLLWAMQFKYDMEFKYDIAQMYYGCENKQKKTLFKYVYHQNRLHILSVLKNDTITKSSASVTRSSKYLWKTFTKPNTIISSLLAVNCFVYSVSLLTCFKHFTEVSESNYLCSVFTLREAYSQLLFYRSARSFSVCTFCSLLF